MCSPRFILVDHRTVTGTVGKMRFLVVDVLNLDEDESFALQPNSIVWSAARSVICDVRKGEGTGNGMRIEEVLGENDGTYMMGYNSCQFVFHLVSYMQHYNERHL